MGFGRKYIPTLNGRVLRTAMNYYRKHFFYTFIVTLKFDAVSISLFLSLFSVLFFSIFFLCLLILQSLEATKFFWALNMSIIFFIFYNIDLMNFISIFFLCICHCLLQNKYPSQSRKSFIKQKSSRPLHNLRIRVLNQTLKADVKS